MATISALRTLLRNINRITVTRTMPDEQVLVDGLGGDVDQVGAVVIGLDLDAGQQAAGFRVVELLRSWPSTSTSAGSDSSPLRNSTMPSTLSGSSWPIWAMLSGRTRRTLLVGLPIADPSQAASDG